ncbi:MAG: nucleotidyl transferase AbiEii/AbiGii toxin family protein [Fibrella sp.]|nr:nucleotidyl transferase AbiEii/AbiGii toxin family protein [Armatimonadota bacterium]
MATLVRDFMAILTSPTAAHAEGVRFLQGGGIVNDTLRQLAIDLEERGIDYSIIGATALSQHGYRRFTEDIDVLLSAEGLQRFHSELVGRGYRPSFTGANKKFRATDGNVPIEIITTDEYPGDGLPKAVRFPDPATEYVVIDEVRTVPLPRLVELKLASGMTGRGRLKDLADVQELIRVLELPADFAEQLDDSVRAKFSELYDDLHGE